MSDDEIRVIADAAGAPLEEAASLQALSFEEAIRRTMGASVSLKVGGITAQLADTYE